MRNYMKWVTVGIGIVVVAVVAGLYVKIHDSHSNVSAADQLLNHSPISDVSSITSLLKQRPDVQVPNSLPFTVTGASVNSGQGPGGHEQFMFTFANPKKKLALSETVIQHKVTDALPYKR